MNTRSAIFWSLDFLKGGALAREIRQIEQELNASQHQLNASLISNFEKLRIYAVKHVPFYQKFSHKKHLTEFPVIDKLTIRQNQNSFVGTTLSLGRLKKVVTSGSTGTPFEFFHDGPKRRRNTADTIYFARQAGFDVGQRLYYLKIWNTVNRKTNLNQFAQNIVPIDVRDLSDLKIYQFLQALRADKSLKGLLGYASAYDAIVSYCDRFDISSITSSVSSIIAMSEALDPYTRVRMSELFSCPVVSRYSNVEAGIIGQQKPDSTTRFELNWASYWIEVLKFDSNEPTGYDQKGRIVITDLCNFAMPMIRYDTGDVGMMSECQETGKRHLSSIEGRRMDQIYDTQGRLVSSFVITNQMWKYPEVLQYQFIQRGPTEYHFRLNVGSVKFSREAELISEFKGYFGNDAVISTSYTDEIPQLASGKRKKVINEMKLNNTVNN